MTFINNNKCKKVIGKLAEDIALDYLKKNKLKFIERNFRSSYGEIDLILEDNNTIIYIEVRYRNSRSFVSALESIDARKCEKIIATSQYFQQCNLKATKKDSRFDVIVINGDIDKPKIEWIKNAFQA